MIKNLATPFLLLLISVQVKPQTNIKSSGLREIRSQVVNFFVSEGYFGGVNIDSLKGELFYAVDLVRKTPLKVDTPGIYWIGLFQSHSKEYLMYYDTTKVTFYRVEDAQTMVCDLFPYSQRNKFSLPLTMNYLTQIIVFLNHKNTGR